MPYIHCDDYLDEPELRAKMPECLIVWLERARGPAHGYGKSHRGKPYPKLFADHKGSRVRVVMASRLGDVGITKILGEEVCYQKRVPLEMLSNFSDSP